MDGATNEFFKWAADSKLLETRMGRVECADFGMGPAVLCLHGAMGGYDQGVILAKTIAEPEYRFIAVSRPGYLRTKMLDHKSPEAQADLYAAVLDTLKIQKTAVIAVSGGGPSAIHFALRYPDRCWGLVLVSTTAGPVANRLPRSFYVMRLLAQIPAFSRAAQKKTQQDPRSVAARSISYPDLLESTMKDLEAWTLLRELQLSTVTNMGQRMKGTVNDVEITQKYEYPLENISAPTLIVHGTCDPLVPFAHHGEMFAKRIPQAKLVALERGEHAAIFSHRQQVRPKVSEFLKLNEITA